MSSAGRRGLVPGLLLVAIGVGWLLESTDTVDLDASVWIGLALVAIGLGIALDSGHSHGLLVTLGVLLVLVGIPLSAIDTDVFDGGVGDRREEPASAADIDDPYELGVGQLVVDLTRLEEDVDVEASVGIGELRVRVPADAALEVDAHVGAGNVSVLGEEDDGVDVTVERDVPGAEGPTMRLELDVGLGEVRVEHGETPSP